MTEKPLAALFAGLLALAPAQAANQSSVSVFTTGPHSAADFTVNSLNPALLAIFTCNWGPGAPANGPGGVPAAYQCWADTSASPVVTFNRYDGANWVAFGKLNTTTHVWTAQTTGFGLTLGGAFTMSGAFSFTGTLTGTTAVTFPTAGTLATIAGVETPTNKILNCANNTCTVRLGSDVTGQLPIANGGTGQAAQAAAISALMPTPTRAGDVVYWNGSNWVTLAGNNSGTQTLQENASGVPSWATVAGTGTVTSATIAGTAGSIAVSGTCTITTSGTCTLDLAAARKTLPTISNVTGTAHSGGFGANASGTYTTPANVLYLEIELVGGGAGGSGGGGASGAAGATCWNTTGAACTTPVNSAGGGSGGTGGTITGSGTCNVGAFPGGAGQGGVSTTAGTSSSGGIGGSSTSGGAGVGVIGATGANAVADSGSGGGGGGVGSAAANTASGGGAGATCRLLINTPAATYTYAVGAQSNGGASGGSAGAGGNGSGGHISIIEHYGS